MEYLATARSVLVQGQQAANSKVARADQRADIVSVYGENIIAGAGRSNWTVNFPVVFVAKPTFHFGFEFDAASENEENPEVYYYVNGAVAVAKWLFRQYGTTNYWVGAVLTIDATVTQIGNFVASFAAREHVVIASPDLEPIVVHHTFTGMSLRSPGFNADSIGETPVVP